MKPLLILISIIYSLNGFTQDKPITLPESSKFKSDSLEVIEVKSKKDPSVATLYSAAVPGLGQAYNKKYWKIPIIYLGFGAGLFAVNDNNNRLQEDRQDLIDTQTGTGFPSGRSEETIQARVDYFRRQRDLFIILTVFWYGLQVADAHIDAHLKEFEVNDDLSMKFDPFLQEDMGELTMGLSIKLKF